MYICCTLLKLFWLGSLASFDNIFYCIAFKRRKEFCVALKENFVEYCLTILLCSFIVLLEYLENYIEYYPRK